MRPSVRDGLTGAAVTIPRYALAERMAQRVKQGKGIELDMAAFVASDIADGAILRTKGLDGPFRRVLDGIVDHAAQLRVCYEVAKKYPEAKKYIGIMAVRATAVGALNLAHLLMTNEVTKGQSWQRAANLTSAMFAVTAAQGNRRRTEIADTITATTSLVTGIAHLRGLGRRHEGGIRKI